jgi:hypothetical protein
MPRIQVKSAVIDLVENGIDPARPLTVPGADRAARRAEIA